MAIDSGKPLGVVSSIDGLKFYAPKALNDGSAAYGASDMAEVTTKTAWTGKSNGYVGYMKYGIHVEADQDPGAAKTLNFKITPTVTDAELKASYRVALYKASSGYAAGDNIGIYSFTQGEKNGWRYADSAFSKTTYTTTAISSVAEATPISGITTASAISHYFIFSVWVEGEDAGATNTGVSGETLQVELEFSLVS